MWVRSEYAGELAVLSTWLLGFMPWTVTVLTDRELTAFFLWFLPGNFLFTPGVGLPGERPFWVWRMPAFFAGRGEVYASYAWVAGAAVFLAALAFSLLYYVDEERVEAWRFDPVRALGAALLVTGLCCTAAFGLLWRFHAGVHLPVGVLFQLAFGAVLLRTERLPSGGPEPSE